MTIAGICELVLETDDVDGLRRFYEELGLRRRDGDGAEDGVMALAEGDGNGS